MDGRSVFSRGAMTAALSALVVLASERAQAAAMDLAPERLTLPCQPTASGVGCGDARVNAAGTGIETNYFRPDNAAWAQLVSQYAVAMAPNAMHPARTTGYGGFEMSLWGQLTSLRKDEVLEKGTEGAISDSKKYQSRNNAPDGVLQVYGVTGRKGLPYGFELQGNVGYMANTEMIILGGGIRLAPFEGFRKIFDISAGGFVHTMTGTNKVKITVPSFDVQVSRRFTIANQVFIQPYVGFQMLWINADSGVIDATPQKDGLALCNARPSSAAEREQKQGTPTPGDTGEFRCQSRAGDRITGDAAAGSPEALAKLDLNNNMVFQNMRAFRRQRIMLGITYRWENLHVILPHVMYDLMDPEAGEPDPGPGKTKRLAGMPRQWTLAATVGLAW